MNIYYGDFHVHVGRTLSGKPVKITGARSLTIEGILDYAANRKGLDMVGVIDCHVPEVIGELRMLIEQGDLAELKEGGLRYKDGTVLIPGSEIEINDEHCKGPVHVLAFFPALQQMELFSNWFSERVKNITLSSQRIYEQGTVLQRKVKELGGLFIPAHIFTPHKSLYGKGVHQSLAEIFDPALIDAVELGLSADTTMASHLSELDAYPFLTNSDAHSLPKLAREYQQLVLEEPSFQEWKKALRGEGGRGIRANYGLNPYLGKYHETVCENCGEMLEAYEARCPYCGSTQVTKGVAERINELADRSSKESKAFRPPYVHHIPLEFLPGLGPKTLDKLVSRFGSEMAVIHDASFEELLEVVPEKIASLIQQARRGELSLQKGGGGIYGKVIQE
ncbi:TIGR00375 family protein [Pradoshia eiseniae]|uniref:TIGR00375 family protein n=1 Tax=Pradoshia eiseniae TaxID=2064768 RepID=A0A2S7N484_9BACI|nr:TIGR00375 family protein [Pradoshia eiseniae]PQD96844.1 TIGR00375 family protein [Pradoshia eiseniae]